MNYEAQGAARFAKFDPFVSRLRTANHQHTPCAICAFIYCLKNFDREAAEIIRQAQFDPGWIPPTDLPLKHEPLKSLWEIESEERELEYARND